MFRLLSCCLLAASSFLAVAQVPTTVFLTRHAEDLAGEDPALSEAGTQRAADLASLLSSVDLRAVMCTDTRRARETGQASAEMAGLELTLVDQGGVEAIAALADQIRQIEGSVLVVGHSNTTPMIVAALGGGDFELGPDDYADLFVVTLVEGESVSTLRLIRP